MCAIVDCMPRLETECLQVEHQSLQSKRSECANVRDLQTQFKPCCASYSLIQQHQKYIFWRTHQFQNEYGAEILISERAQVETYS